MARWFVFDNQPCHEVRIDGGPETIIRRASSQGRRLTVLDSEPAIFTISSAGPRIYLSNLIIEGKVDVQGGSMDRITAPWTGSTRPEMHRA